MKIDVHNHIYPQKFMEQLAIDGPAVGIEVKKDAAGQTTIYRYGTRIVTMTPPMMDIDLRLKDMDAAGFDIQILTTSIPGVEVFPHDVGVNITRLLNDEMAAIAKAHPDRFIGFGSLYFPDMEETVKETDRCIEELGLKGFTIGSHINGMRLDNEHMYPFYERLCQHDLPIHMHPRPPLDKETYKDFGLGALIGFECDISVSVARLVFSGTLEKFDKLKLIVPHLGAGITFLSERIEFGWEHYPECHKIPHSAKYYLKKLYYDSVNSSKDAVHPTMCTYGLVGADHMVLGTDYPHVLGDIHQMLLSIEALPITNEEKEKIYSKNILGLLNM